MGKRLRTEELLGEIQRERSALDDTLVLLSARQMTKPGVTRGGWSVKDVLAHLVEWQRMNLGWYAAGLRGETPAMPAPGYTLRELPRLNAMIYRKHHQRSVAAVMRDYRLYHERVVSLIKALPDADLVTLNRFSWTGPSWTLSDYLRAATAAHYLWARTRIRRWWRAQEKAMPRRVHSSIRRPRMTDRSKSFESLLARAAPGVATVARRLRALVYALDPDTVETPRLGERTVGYGVGPKKMSDTYAYIAPYATHVNLGFYHGAALPDPDALLEGTGKALRHVKVQSADQAARPALRRLLAAAIAERKRARGSGRAG